jgi:nicotinate-nucleotide adenylyltransferase
VKIALLGGSFNPPHVGHLMAAYWALATHGVDRVWLMPVFEHPFHKVLAPFEDRVRMCELAAEDLRHVEVSRVESEVRKDGWTWQTLEFLRARQPTDEFALVVGSDLMLERDKWKRFDRVVELARLIVIHRAGYDVPEAMGPVLAEVSSTEVRRRLACGDDVSRWIPERVLRYVQQKRLYSPEPASNSSPG